MNNVKGIIRKLIIGFVLTLIVCIAFYFYYGNAYTIYLLLIGTIVSIIFSKVYLLPFAFMKIEGTVTKSKVKTYYDRKLTSSATGRAAGSSRTAIGYSYSSRLKVVVSIRTIQGRWFRKAFDFESEEDNLPVGTKIRFTIFDNRPEILKMPQNFKHQ